MALGGVWAMTPSSVAGTAACHCSVSGSGPGCGLRQRGGHVIVPRPCVRAERRRSTVDLANGRRCVLFACLSCFLAVCTTPPGSGDCSDNDHDWYNGRPPPPRPAPPNDCPTPALLRDGSRPSRPGACVSMAMIRTTAPTTTATGTTAPSAAALGPSLTIITTPQPTTGPPTPPSRPPPRPPPRSHHHHHHDHRHHHHHHHHGRPSPSTLRCRVSAPPNLLRRILVFGNRSRRTTAVLRRPLPIAPPTTSVATICLFGDYSHDCPARMHAAPPPFMLYRLLRYRRLPRSNDAPMADPTPTAT